MKYLIDSANLNEIDEALAIGAVGITANPSMYLKENIDFYNFLIKSNNYNTDILTAEVLGEDLDKMLGDVDKILSINKDIIIKINFSAIGLKLVNILTKRNIKTAMTLIFNVNQATLAINAGANFLFPFIGRNDENGDDGLSVISDICKYISINKLDTKVVAASVKNLNHLKYAALSGADYVAIPFNLMEKAMFHNLTISGANTFNADWSKVSRNEPFSV